jgi:hypothetical protein
MGYERLKSKNFHVLSEVAWRTSNRHASGLSINPFASPLPNFAPARSSIIDFAIANDHNAFSVFVNIRLMIRNFMIPPGGAGVATCARFCPSKTPRRDVLRLSLDGLDAPR